MDHLDVVTGASLTNPITARLTERFSGSSLEDGLNRGPGGCRTTGHEGRTVTSTLLSSRDARANEQEALLLELLGPSDGVGVVGITAIDDDIALLEMGNKLLNKGINSIASLDKEDNFAWPLELGGELLDGVSALDLGSCKAKGPSIRSCQEKNVEGNKLTFGFVGEEIVNLGGGSVVGNNGEALIVDVQNEVLTLSKREIAVRNHAMWR